MYDNTQLAKSVENRFRKVPATNFDDYRFDTGRDIYNTAGRMLTEIQ